jgi:hypothetical protein
MDLSKIFAIAGKPGLYKMLTHTKNGLVVESLNDGKRFTAFSHEKISNLEEISIYTTDEDMPLKEVLKAIYDKLNGGQALSHKSNDNELRDFFGQAIPNYDKENVYISDIKKVIYWYNSLHEHKLLDFSEKSENKESEKPETVDEVLTDQPVEMDNKAEETK